MSSATLVTGASGFVGAHVLDLLLKRGYHVRGTVRSQRKADQILAQYPQYKGKLDFVIVEDISRENAFQGKLDGISGIFHVASPFHFKVTTSNKVDLLDPAVNGTVGILKEAAKVPSVKRVVITSSFAAIMDGSKPADHVRTEADWNPVTWEQALTSDAYTAYLASKKLAEKAAFDFVEENKPHFDVATLCPPYVFGPIVHHIDKLEELGESTKVFYEYVSGKREIEASKFDVYVDVRDLALAHLLAFENPKASGQRYLALGGNFNWQEVVDLAHKEFPNQTKARVGKPGTHPPTQFLADNTKTRTELGLTYRPKEETFRDIIAQLIQFEKEGK